MKKILYLISSILILVACEDNSSNNKATLSIRLTDAPGSYDEVLIDIQDIQINPAGINDEESWESMENTNLGIFNLLEFTNGLDTLLAEQELPAGKISQIRLVLGSDNKIKKDGEYYNIQTPSAHTSGLKLNVHAELTAGITYKLWIDFDAGRSIVERGNGTFLLKPVIRTFTEATSGAIKGVVNPVDVKSYIMAISKAADTVGVFSDTITGNFLIPGLEQGDYTVELQPEDGYSEVKLENISVVNGDVTVLDTVFLSMPQL